MVLAGVLCATGASRDLFSRPLSLPVGVERLSDEPREPLDRERREELDWLEELLPSFRLSGKCGLGERVRCRCEERERERRCEERGRPRRGLALRLRAELECSYPESEEPRELPDMLNVKAVVGVEGRGWWAQRDFDASLCEVRLGATTQYCRHVIKTPRGGEDLHFVSRMGEISSRPSQKCKISIKIGVTEVFR